MTAALENYQARMQRVLDYIDRHLDGDLDLDTVSAVAAFSKFHFHRQFTATFELSVHRYVQLARMKRASHRLARDFPICCQRLSFFPEVLEHEAAAKVFLPLK